MRPVVLVAIYCMMRPALLLALLAPTAALQLNRRDALKGTTASVAQIALTPAVASAAASEKLALPKMGIGAWAWGDSLFWGSYLCRNKSLAARSC